MWTTKRPSNIAVIKYMGKKPGEKNVATNPSLSWTLDHLSTRITMEKAEVDSWQPLSTSYPVQLSAKGKERYLGHLKFLKQHFKNEKNYLVSSGNNFPADCGIASSASSFAALTDCAVQIMKNDMDDLQRAQLSSKGSGSSCRSFLPGWVLWEGDEIKQVSSPWDQMHHMVVIVGDGKKEVSSSEAHQRVSTSPQFEGRTERAEQRLEQCLQCFEKEDWQSFYKLVWDEFKDMHKLFETSKPAFSYFLPESHQILKNCETYWSEVKDGPLVTMDAGANIHLLWRMDQQEQALLFYKKTIQHKYTCLTNMEGIGFATV